MKKKLTDIENKIDNNSNQQPVIQQLKEEIKNLKRELKGHKPNNKDKPNQDNDKPNESPEPRDEEDESEEPEDNSDDPNKPNKSPYEREGMISYIFKWNGCIKQGYWLFENPRQKLKVNISQNHSFLKGKKLDNSDETPPFAIRFNKKNASKQEGDKTFYFDGNNTNFEIDPFGDWPDENSQEEEPQNNKNEVKVKYVKENFTKNYVFSGNKTNFEVNKNHPQIKELLSKNKLQKDKEFIIRYGKIDSEFNFGVHLIFNENNQELEIEEV